MIEGETQASDIGQFYVRVFRAEHRVPANIALHMAGVVAGIGLLVASATVIAGWWALLFPVVHAVPGLIGHRLFERDIATGDVRVTRTDFPLWWFIIANHRMTFDVLTGRYSRGR
jgi:hypothetical protein